LGVGCSAKVQNRPKAGGKVQTKSTEYGLQISEKAEGKRGPESERGRRIAGRR